MLYPVDRWRGCLLDYSIPDMPLTTPSTLAMPSTRRMQPVVNAGPDMPSLLPRTPRIFPGLPCGQPPASECSCQTMEYLLPSYLE